ncbi:hypothetical protein D3876_08125 [Sphingomonas cavernae]|uniref:Uncharacterized protein n=2 Tax=Sphingomonas cavernae TaxID=2320861 RepID=A0A418WJR0_9SPHN|nr:hypothetical protein D3876_08125 [Sphingomonas cavernae]
MLSQGVSEYLDDLLDMSGRDDQRRGQCDRISSDPDQQPLFKAIDKHVVCALPRRLRARLKFNAGYETDCAHINHVRKTSEVVHGLFGEFARESGIPRTTSIYRLIRRLSCTACGGRPVADVTRYRGGN